MNRILFSLILVFLCFGVSGSAEAKGKADNELLNNYSIAGAGTSSSDGCYMVRVNVTTKNPRLSDADVARCAVHGVLFKGFSGENMHYEKPLAGKASVEDQHSEYFKKFFENQAQGYVNLIASTRSVSKVDKKKYVVSQVVEVRKDQLRRALQDAGVIHSLNSAF